MTRKRVHIIAWSSGAVAAFLVPALALAATGMTRPLQDHPVRMSSLRVQGLPGYVVRDSRGEAIGHIVRVEADTEGRTRYLHIALDQGSEVTVAAFRAMLDAHGRDVTLVLPEDAVLARAEPDATPIPPSV